MIKRSNAAEEAADKAIWRPASQGWKRSVVAAAAMVALCVPLDHALALTLGRVTVLSALGEPLRAEVELPDITEEEARTLQTSVAPPQAFRAAGLEYSAALASVRIERQRRADGRTVLRLSSDQAINEPFVDLILQANWAAGRVVRDYTLLFDPPRQRQAQAVVPTAPQLPSPSVAATPPAPVPQAATPQPPALAAPPTPPIARAPATVPSPRPAPTARTSAPPPVAVPPPPADSSVTVRRGDTASRIAAANRPRNVSLEQMLVAMLRENPQAFMDGNVNRLRAGAVLDLPSAEQAQSVPASEASRMIAAQSRDFNAYRGQLAAQVPTVSAGAQRSASGRVQAQVDDSRPGATAPDRLTLSKGGVQARAQDEKIAQDKASKEADERVAELSRNIEALNQLGQAGGPAPTASAAASAPATPSEAPAAASASAPAAQDKMVAAPALPPPAEKTGGLLENLRDNPALLGAGAALLALLAALSVFRARQRKKAADEEKRLQEPVESFFASSGGHHVDTGAEETAASAVYAPSQLDSSGDVDPLAEADVYIAYGRDLQAEEILKEALRATPERVALHAKLAEIYAKRRDAAAFQAVAERVHALTDGQGPEWDQVAEQGRALLPEHSLWRTGAALGLGAAAVTAAAQTQPPSADGGESLWPDSVLTPPDEPSPEPFAQPPLPDITLDLGEDIPTREETAAPAPAPVPAAAAATEPAPPPLADAVDLDFDVQSTYAAPLQPAAPPPAPADSDLLPFDLGSLSLDLGDAADKPAEAETSDEPAVDDPLATKLALAEEFQAIGDDEGARALAEEVRAEATGALKVRAERFLASLG